MEQTLVGLFEKNEEQFRRELAEIKLPRDQKKLQEFIMRFFVDKVSVNDYKRELTMAEASMLNSAIKLVSHPMSILGESCIPCTNIAINAGIIGDYDSKERIQDLLERVKLPVIGWSAAGGIIGGIALNTWGGVLGAIAGSVLGMYINTDKKQVEEKCDTSINVDKYITMLKKVCMSIDEFIVNYRVSINRIKESYENREPVTLATAYRPLLDRFASMFVSLKELSVPSDVQNEINNLYRTLKNHHYEIVDYSDSTSNYYVETESEHITDCTLIKAAILEDGKLLIKGECLVPIKK